MERLIEIGKIKAYKSNEIKQSRFGIGLEKLDRNLYDPSKTYDFLQDLGMKYVRLQSGWARTERKEGEYDFAWLDEIVDNLLSRGIQPWLCMCYGNGLYSADANKYFGAVGVPPIFTERERTAWANYCVATATHFKGRIKMYEVWNEPDGVWCWKHGVNGEEYGEFVINTSKAIKSVDESAQILGGSMASRFHLEWLKDALKVGMADYIDAYTFHYYAVDCAQLAEEERMLRLILKNTGKDIPLIQGEAGSPSAMGAGAMGKGMWSEDKQAKLLLRRHLYDLQSSVAFFSHFTTVDSVEALTGEVKDKNSYLDYGHFGVLSAQFDENGVSVGEYRPKKSYYALQTLSSLLFNAEKSEFPIMEYNSEYNYKTLGMSERSKNTISCAFKKANGSSAFCYYKPTDIMTETYNGVISLIADAPNMQIRLVDLMDGKVYQLPEEMLVDAGNGIVKLMLLPLRDYPLMLTFGDFFEFERQ